MALVGLALLGLLTLCGVPRAWGLGAAAAGVIAYSVLCQPGASVVRATLVGLLALGTQAAGRPGRSGYPLIVTFAAMIAWEPRAISDPGLVLSFSAVVGILLFATPLRTWLGRWMPDPLALSLAVTAAATLATAPASGAFFGQVSLVGLASNLAAVPLAGVVLVCGLVGALAGLAWAPLAVVPLAIAAGGAHLLVVIADRCAALPAAAVSGRAAGLLGIALAGIWVVGRVASGHAAFRRVATGLRNLR